MDDDDDFVQEPAGKGVPSKRRFEAASSTKKKSKSTTSTPRGKATTSTPRGKGTVTPRDKGVASTPRGKGSASSTPHQGNRVAPGPWGSTEAEAAGAAAGSRLIPSFFPVRQEPSGQKDAQQKRPISDQKNGVFPSASPQLLKGSSSSGCRSSGLFAPVAAPRLLARAAPVLSHNCTSAAPGSTAVGTCPICGISLDRVSDTELGRTAHVNSCLDTLAGGRCINQTAPLPMNFNAPLLSRSPAQLGSPRRGLGATVPAPQGAHRPAACTAAQLPHNYPHPENPEQLPLSRDYQAPDFELLDSSVDEVEGQYDDDREEVSRGHQEVEEVEEDSGLENEKQDVCDEDEQRQRELADEDDDCLFAELQASQRLRDDNDDCTRMAHTAAAAQASVPHPGTAACSSLPTAAAPDVGGHAEIVRLPSCAADLESWLTRYSLPPHYAELLAAAEVMDLDLLRLLSDTDLQEVGIDKDSHRQRILQLLSHPVIQDGGTCADADLEEVGIAKSHHQHGNMQRSSHPDIVSAGVADYSTLKLSRDPGAGLVAGSVHGGAHATRSADGASDPDGNALAECSMDDISVVEDSFGGAPFTEDASVGQEDVSVRSYLAGDNVSKNSSLAGGGLLGGYSIGIRGKHGDGVAHEEDVLLDNFPDDGAHGGSALHGDEEFLDCQDDGLLLNEGEGFLDGRCDPYETYMLDDDDDADADATGEDGVQLDRMGMRLLPGVGGTEVGLACVTSAAFQEWDVCHTDIDVRYTADVHNRTATVQHRTAGVQHYGAGLQHAAGAGMRMTPKLPFSFHLPPSPPQQLRNSPLHAPTHPPAQALEVHNTPKLPISTHLPPSPPQQPPRAPPHAPAPAPPPNAPISSTIFSSIFNLKAPSFGRITNFFQPATSAPAAAASAAAASGSGNAAGPSTSTNWTNQPGRASHQPGPSDLAASTSYWSKGMSYQPPVGVPGGVSGTNLTHQPTTTVEGLGRMLMRPLGVRANVPQQKQEEDAGGLAPAVGGTLRQLAPPPQQQQQYPQKWRPAPPRANVGVNVDSGSDYGGLPKSVPRWQTIPGSRLVVDKFGKGTDKISACTHWILTHFHADHYMGLTKHFDKGVVVCTPVTAQLISTKLKVPWERILPVQMDTTTVVDGVPLTFVNANHCPGAAMIIAEPPGRPPVLHTGDCRLVEEMRDSPALSRLQGRCILVLDTTYCDPQYDFPPQAAVLKYSLGAVATERFNPRCLFVFGSYTIGKERLFLEVAKWMEKKVYVCKEKYQTLQCCNFAPEYMKLLTTNHLDTNIHAVPMFKVSIQGLSEILSHYKGRYNTIVGFRPTGWTQQKQQKTAHCGKKTQKGKVILHEVPYSEHSSFSELTSFVSWLRPIEIVPSVNNDYGGSKCKHMLDLLTRPESKRKQPTISSMLQAAARKPQNGEGSGAPTAD